MNIFRDAHNSSIKFVAPLASRANPIAHALEFAARRCVLFIGCCIPRRKILIGLNFARRRRRDHTHAQYFRCHSIWLIAQLSLQKKQKRLRGGKKNKIRNSLRALDFLPLRRTRGGAGAFLYMLCWMHWKQLMHLQQWGRGHCYPSLASGKNYEGETAELNFFRENKEMIFWREINKEKVGDFGSRGKKLASPKQCNFFNC